MPRRREVEHRKPPPDAVYNSTLVSKFINCLMKDGKKSVSERIFYDGMEKVRERSKDDPLTLFKKAIENCKPVAIMVRISALGIVTFGFAVSPAAINTVSKPTKA